MHPRTLLALLGLATVSQSIAESYVLRPFRKIQVTDHFWSEGAHVGDFNRDGHPDITSGPFWYAGPSFRPRNEYRPATASFKRQHPDGQDRVIPGFEGGLGVKNAYSDNFFTFTADFNQDGWTDIFVIGLPGDPAHWYENPKGGAGHWTRHVAFPVVDNESPTFLDLTGDGRPELVCNAYGRFGYATPNLAKPTEPWTFHAISPDRKYHKYYHGLGAGDINGDGKTDLLESNGWWEQPSSLAGDPEWKWHEFIFCPADPGVPVGGAQLFAYDVDGDGLNDVITSLAAHGYGLAWYQQTRSNGKIGFQRHMVINKKPHENPYGVAFSQLHALDLVDMDGDGLKDIVTGKRFWAHGPDGDPEPREPALLYWFRLVRQGSQGTHYVPYRIDDNSGVGTQVLATDLNGDSHPDIVVGNKKGTFAFIQQPRRVNRQTWEASQPRRIDGSSQR